MQGMRELFSTGGRRGFTLVELMIAMALVGVLTALIYGLFVRTSDALVDVEGMSKALDQARFGVDHMRSDLNSAGAHITSNVDVDPWFFMPDDDLAGGGLTVHGIMGYDGWQNSDAIYDLSEVDDDMGDANPRSEFSGVILLGAYNIPANLKVSFPGGPTGAINHDTTTPMMIVESTEGGMDRLLGYDPFDVAARDGIVLDSNVSDMYAPSSLTGAPARVDASLLRVTNSDGFSQVATIDSSGSGVEIVNRDATDSDSGAGMVTGSGDVLHIPLNELYFSSGDDPTGFDPHAEPDVRYDAALIDAYWYYVRPAVDDRLGADV